MTVTVSIVSFEVIGELQRERLRQSRAEAFSWNGRTRGQFLQAKSRVPGADPGGGGGGGGGAWAWALPTEPTLIAAVCRALSARRCRAEVYADIKRSKLQLPRDSFVVAAMRYIVLSQCLGYTGG